MGMAQEIRERARWLFGAIDREYIRSHRARPSLEQAHALEGVVSTPVPASITLDLSGCSIGIEGERFRVSTLPPWHQVVLCNNCKTPLGLCDSEETSSALGRAIRRHICPNVVQPWQEIA